MTRALQRKFVFTAMAAITGLLLLLLGAINGANLWATNSRLEHTLALLSVSGGEADRLPPQPPHPEPPDFGLPRPQRNNYDIFMGSNFFVVGLSHTGDPVYVDVSRTSRVDQETAAALAAAVYETSQASGKISGFLYQASPSPVWGVTVVFLDTSQEAAAFLQVLALSAGASLACWTIMLAVVVLLSKRAIRPFAENVQRQKEFVTGAGHELKTPLAIIQSNTEAMELYNGATKWSKNIREQTARLNRLVQSLLFLARMDEGALHSQPVELPLDQLVSQALDTFAQPMEDCGLQLHKEVTAGLSVRGDREQVRQLLSILLDNAVKYTNPGGLVTVALRPAKGQVQLSVQNTCSPLPEAPPQQLFQRFYRADAARSQKNGGCGVGLSMAQAIAQANGADISARYIQPDQVVFTVVFHGV